MADTRPMKALILLIALSASAQDLPKRKAQVMSADYRADLKELARLHEELAKYPKDYLARYWSGFASWRIAMNGANHGMKSDQLQTNLKSAAADFYVSIQLKDDFADAYAAASLVNGWLAVFVSSDPAALRERIALSSALQTKARALDPTNPRVLWSAGAVDLYSPRGSIPKAIETYGEMLKEAEKRGVDANSPLPDWGKAEALMSLAYAHMMLKPADKGAAREEARAALKVQPEWSYVRDNLMQLIDAK
jgi:tetratricopeptide (TPR) repeat protein